MNPTNNLSVKNSFSASAVLLMITSMASVYAEEGAITQTHTQGFTHTEPNSQVSDSNFGQSRNREKHTVINQKQSQHQYKYMNQHLNKESNPAASSMNRLNTMDYYMQGNRATDFLNRQNTASRSMSGGVIKVF